MCYALHVERAPPPTPQEKPRYQRQGAASQRGEESFSSSDDSSDSSSSSWAVEPKTLAAGVIVARTLISDGADKAAVRVVNCNSMPYFIQEGNFHGDAMPAKVVAKTSPLPTAAEQSPQTSQAPLDSDQPKLVSQNYTLFAADPHEHLQPLIQSLPDDITKVEKETAENFIRDNADLFSKSEFDIGRTHLVQHHIDTGMNRPFRQALRRHPMAYLPIIDQHVEDMLANDIVEPAVSPWCSNVVLVRKADGGLRFCVDYRQLNELTYKDSYPLPRIDMCLSTLGGSQFFSCLDLRSGYWQCEIAPEDRDKTCFVTRRGTFRFKVLSFGLANAPALFQRLMDLKLVDLTWEICLVYLDDIIVIAKDFSQHLERLCQVFDKLRAASLKLKPSKCKLFQREVIFLGHKVSAAGITPDPQKIQAVRSWPRARTLRDVRAFLGLAGYYRSHIEIFAKIAKPLHDLTKKHQTFCWDECMEEAFVTLKTKLTSAPVLATPKDEGLYCVDSDASDCHVEAVLQQNQDGVYKVIAYASRVLSAAERNTALPGRNCWTLSMGSSSFVNFFSVVKNLSSGRITPP